MKDIPYSVLTQEGRAYEMLLLRDQYGNTFTDIAKEFGISVVRVMQIYHCTKMKQVHLYINHIAVALGHQNTSQIREVWENAYECYQDYSYACAYLEKKYADILTAYRDGEPGMPEEFMKRLPPFRLKLSEQTVAQVIEMREAEKASFVKIAKELHMTHAKAKHTYEWFYHIRVLKMIRALDEKAESKEAKMAIWYRYFWSVRSSKQRYDLLTGCTDEINSETAES